ncbi:MAG: hypothetical protein ABW209_11700, partial [Pseudomonas caspiana]
VRKWAAENPQQVKRAASKNELANVAEKVRGQAMQELENLNSQGTHFLKTFLTEDNPLLRLWRITPLGWYLTRRK